MNIYFMEIDIWCMENDKGREDFNGMINKFDIIYMFRILN